MIVLGFSAVSHRIKFGLPAVVEELEKPPGNPPLSSPVKYLLWLANKQLPTLLFGAFWGIISVTSLAIWPYVLGIAIDESLNGELSAGTIALWSGILLGITIVHSGANIVHHRMEVASWLRASLRSSRLIGHTASRAGGALNKAVPTGEVVTAVATDTMRMGDMFSGFNMFIGSAIAYIVVAIMLLRTSVTLGIAVLLGMPIVLGVLALVVRPLQRRQDEHRSAMGELTTLGSDTVAGLRILRGIGGEDVFLSRYHQQSQEVRRRGEKVAVPQSLMDGLEILLPGLFLAGVMLYASLLTLDGEISTGELIAVYGMSTFLAMPLHGANQFAQITSRALVASRKIVAILKVEPDVGDDGLPAEGAAEENLDADTFDPISGLRLTTGKLTAIVCADPDVSAEIANRLGRFNDTNPHEAHIEFAGRNIRHWPINYVRRRMVISEAMPHLFSGPILEALDPFYARSPQPDNGDQESHEDRMSRVTMALWNADGTEIVEQLPSQFADRLTEQGRSLSGGQRQRLALARALLTDADTLVLIEPTSAVDAHSEARIAERVKQARLGKTTAIVTVSPLILEHADTVVLIDPKNKNAVAEGGHRELLAHNPAYRDVVSRGQ